MKKLYYTVYKETDYINGIEETTGLKNITVYKIISNVPKIFCMFDAGNELNSRVEIQEWLDENGYEDKEFEFIEL